MARRKSTTSTAAAGVAPYRPHQAVVADAAPRGAGWLHELKIEGHRVGCLVQAGGVRLFDHEGQPLAVNMRQIEAALQALPVRAALLDGQVTHMLPDGRTQRLPSLERSSARAVYMVYDLLHLDGVDLRPLPIEDRKRTLQELLQRSPSPFIRYTDHVVGGGTRVWAQACQLKVGGIVCKALGTPYEATGNRSWREIRCAPDPVAEVASTATSTSVARVAGVKITTPTRPVYPRLHATKVDLAQYYAAVAERMLPYIAGRPLTLVRCEKGVSQQNGLRTECKFLRHEPGWHRWVRPPIRRVHIAEQKKTGEYLVVDSAHGLLSLIQGDIIEIHVWNSTVDHLETPDRFVFDIDPGPDVAWDEVVQTALRMRQRLSEDGLASWPKVTGGKGLHVVVPFAPEHDWAAAYAAAHRLCQSLVEEQPERLTLDFGKAGRSSKILLDYKRNHRAAVAVAAYSARANPQGTVSLPVAWRELEGQPRPAWDFRTAQERVKSRDPWTSFWACRQRLRVPRR